MALILWQRGLREAWSKKQANKWKTRIGPCICMAKSLHCLPETVTTLLIGSCCSVAKLGPSLLWPHGLQHTGLPCPPLSPGACSNSHPFSQWCHPTISSSVVPFSSWSQSFAASGSFPLSWLFTSGGQSIGASVSESALPMNIQGWFSLGLPGLVSLQSKGLSRVFSNTTVQKHQFFSTQLSLWSEKNHSFD